MPKGNRMYKDRLFKFVFNDKEKLLSLYNALNHSDYKDADALDEFMRCIGYAYSVVDNPFEDCRKYVHVDGVTRETLILKNGVFDENGKIKDIRKKEVLNQYIIHRIDVDEEDITYEDLPF